MFPQRVYPNLSEDQYYDGFPNIEPFTYFDGSLTATARAIISKRLKDDERVRFRYNSTSYSSSTLRGVEPHVVINIYANEEVSYTKGIVKFHNLNGGHDNNKSFEILDEHYKDTESILKDFERLDDISKFLEAKGVRTRFYINKEKHNAVIVCEEMDDRRFHLIQSLLPRYMPWLFDEAPLEQDEILLLKSLTSKSSTEYVKLIDQFAEKFDLRSMVIRKKLKGFEIKFEKRELESCKSEINSILNNIRDLENRFAEYARSLREKQIRRDGLEFKINNSDGNDQVMDYFLASKVLELKDVRNTNVKFYVKTVIDNFDIDVFDSYVSNRRCYLYGSRPSDSPFTADDIEMFLRAAFEEDEFKIQVCAGYEVDFGNGSYTAYSHHTYPESISRTHISNPHLDMYGCQGNNGNIIRESLTNRDYIGAIEACIAMTKNFNFADSAPGGYLVDWLFSPDAKSCVRMPDGTTKTPHEALVWLKEKRGMTTEA